MTLLGNVASIAGKLVTQGKLLRADPEAFVRNITQFTNPSHYFAKLKDLPDIKPVIAVSDPNVPPTLNVLLPGIGPHKMTGGPNSVIQVACAIANYDTVAIRFVACDEPPAGDEAWFWQHFSQLTGQSRPPNAALARHPNMPLRVGPNDTFLASFWTTAHQAQDLVRLTETKQFLYLIQDFEPGFYPWSSRYAMALETYGMDFHPIVNQAHLADFFFATKTGRFADPGFREACTTFEPAIDRDVFNPGPARATRPGPRRLLVYARPTNPRNMLGMALEALDVATQNDAFRGDWEFLAIGARGSLPATKLKSGRDLREAPWTDYKSYAKLLQESDILLCPMLSPHTGYPVLEMAACGGLSVTNTFANKTAQRMSEISPAILAVQPTKGALAQALEDAAQLIGSGLPQLPSPTLPSRWMDALVGLKGVTEKLNGNASKPDVRA